MNMPFLITNSITTGESFAFSICCYSFYSGHQYQYHISGIVLDTFELAGRLIDIALVNKANKF
jgi:hypothetical protein